MGCEAELLRKSADLLEPTGAWCKGSYDNGRGAHCVIGATIAVCREYQTLSMCYAQSLKALSAYLDFRDIVAWNDSPDITQEDVVSALRGTASRLESHAM